jgi:hypothetical protein
MVKWCAICETTDKCVIPEHAMGGHENKAVAMVRQDDDLVCLLPYEFYGLF